MKRLAWLLLLGCTDSDPTVVVYDGLDDEPGRMVVAQAQRELPFTVKRLGDTEATKPLAWSIGCDSKHLCLKPMFLCVVNL